MKKLISFLAASTFALMSAGADTSAPHLETHHGVKQLYVDGKPFLILGGELGNSAASSAAWMKPIWPQLAARHLNTVLASLSWQMIEPEEGRFDFTSVDDCLSGARSHNLHLVFLWFASWKNGQSSYPPDWVKNDPGRFPLVKDDWGNTRDTLSTFGDATRDADAKAFAALMRHIKRVDGQAHTVLMMQVENEVGILGDSRDHSPAANAAYAAPVPKALMNYLVAHKSTLAPELLAVWEANGHRTAGTWEQVFGPGKPKGLKLHGPDLTPELKASLWQTMVWGSDEMFMAWRYAGYVNQIAAAGKAEYDLPMYCNAWQQQPGGPRPGEYPSGGPVPQVNDVWRFGAPKIDLLAPDLYLPQFDWVCARYTRNGNPLFIPEANTGGSAPGNALIALIKYNGLGYSPFGIERERPGGRNLPAPGGSDLAPGSAPPPDALAQTYALLQYLSPQILACQGQDAMVLLDETTDTNAVPKEVKLGDYTLRIKYGVSAEGGGRGGRGGSGGFGGGATVTNVSPLRLVLCTGPGAYTFVGGPMTVTFKPNQPSHGKVILSSTVETINEDGTWLPGRWLNGDETYNNIREKPEESGVYIRNFGVYHYSVFQRP